MVALGTSEHSSHSNYSKYIQFDVTTDSFNKVIADIDCVIYLVATLLPQLSNENVKKDVVENLIPVIDLLDAMSSNAKCRKIIFASSGGTVYGAHPSKVNESTNLNPKCSYGIIKSSVEKYLTLYSDIYGIQTVSLRISNPYGAGQDASKPQGAIGIFINKMLKNEAVEIWGDGSVVRDYIYIDDVARAFILAIHFETKSSVFNIGSGIGTSLNQLLERLFRVTKSKSQIIYKPSRNVDVPINILDITQANNVLHWQPQMCLEDGIEKLFKLQMND